MSKHEVRSVSAELRAVKNDDGSRTLTGLIPYGSPSVDMGYREMIAPGAFASALGADADVRALKEHDPKMLLGRTSSGTLTLTDTDDGLRYSVKLPNTSYASDLAESVNRGDITATSFGFICNEAVWSYTEDDEVLRTLMDVELVEVSPTAMPAYTDAAIAIRSAPVEFRSRLEGEVPPPAPDVPAVNETKEHIEMTLALRKRQ